MKTGTMETQEESYSTPRAYKPAGMPPPQKKLHREAKRKIEDKPDEKLKSARRTLSAMFTSMPCPQTPEPSNRTVYSAASASEGDTVCHDKATSCGSATASQSRPSDRSLTMIVQSCMSVAGMRTRKMAAEGCMAARQSQSCPCKPHSIQSRGLGAVAPNA